VRHRLGNLAPFFPEGPTLGEHTQFSIPPGKVGTGEHRGEDELTEALVALHSLKGRHGLPEVVDPPTIVTLGSVD
jgi:hypothetical protein